MPVFIKFTKRRLKVAHAAVEYMYLLLLDIGPSILCLGLARNFSMTSMRTMLSRVTLMAGRRSRMTGRLRK